MTRIHSNRYTVLSLMCCSQHLPMTHWSALSQNRLTATLLLNNIVERMVAPFGVREEGGFVEQEDAIMGICFWVNQVMLYVTCIKLIMPQMCLYQTTTTQSNALYTVYIINQWWSCSQLFIYLVHFIYI